MAAEEPTTKRCPKCARFLPLIAFGKEKGRKDGLKCWCRECHNKSSQQDYRQNKEARLAKSRDRRLRNPQRHRDYLKKSRQKHRARRKADSDAWRKANPNKVRLQSQRYYDKNREAILERNHGWRLRNPEAAKACSANYKAKNPDRISALKRGYKAKKKGASGTHTAEDVMNILRMQKRRCAYCRCRLGLEYHVDHIVPLSKGGDNSPKNLQITCVSCNLKKKDKDPIVFARKLGRLL